MKKSNSKLSSQGERLAPLISFVKNILASRKKTITVIVILLVAGIVGYQKLKPQVKPTYQTSTVEKGTLITTVQGSGQIVAANSIDVTTSATGTVKAVFVKNGDTVKKGQTIATLTLDPVSLQKETQAYASYLQAKVGLDSANTNLYTLQSQAFAANQKLMNDAVARNLATNDPTYIQENANWLAAEASYNNQQNAITQAKVSLSSAALSYQQASSKIVSPVTGTITGLAITSGFPITSTSGSYVLASIKTSGKILAQVNISEVDSINIKGGEKVTITADALTDKTFTGRVVGINTNGVVSSGVTSYPATIEFDTDVADIYPNMGINVQIITKIKDNVLLVPSAAVQTENGQKIVRVIKDGNINVVTVEAGDSSDTQTEVTSGLSEGDTVVVGTISTTSSSSSSPFSSTRGGFGGAIRVGGGGGR